jgi:hypothetical protein
MVGERPGEDFSSRLDRLIKGPGAQDASILEHEVPVNSLPMMLEQHEPTHHASNLAGSTSLCQIEPDRKTSKPASP